MSHSTSDPVIDEIREIRHQISESVGHDPVKLVAYYMEFQKQYQDRLISNSASTPAEADQEAHAAA